MVMPFWAGASLYIACQGMRDGIAACLVLCWQKAANQYCEVCCSNSIHQVVMLSGAALLTAKLHKHQWYQSDLLADLALHLIVGACMLLEAYYN